MDANRFDAVTRFLHPNVRRRLSLLAPSMALLAGLLVVSPVAFSAVRLGNDTEETLTGTHQADQITGGGGNDTLRGLAGNDTYYFKDGWGTDTLEELATYKVRGKKKPGGTDTLSFRGVTGGSVDVILTRQWNFNRVIGPSGAFTDLGQSVVENVVGTRGATNDFLIGGGEANTLSTGGGSGDRLVDVGGWKDGAEGRPGLPASSDAFRGAAANTGTVSVLDWGGAGDVLDLRPLASDEVYLEAVSCDEDAARECLQVVTGTGDGMVVVGGQFGEYFNETTDSGQQGRIEILRFADGEVRLDGDVSMSAAAASAETTASLSGKPLTKRQQKLAKRAPALLEAALQELADQPELGTQRVDTGDRGEDAGPRPGTEPEKDRGTADRGKSTQKDMKDRKHDKQAKKREQKDKSDKSGKCNGLQRRSERLGQRDLGLRGRALDYGQGGSR